MPNFSTPDKISIVIYDHHFDKVHYALVIASAAAAIGKPVTLFFTMGASQALLDEGPNALAAWAKMPLSDEDGSGYERDQSYKDKGVASFEELLQACASLGIKFMVCEMGLQAKGIKSKPLRNDLSIEVSGVVTFLNDASSSGVIVFI
jgi:peroxiredoxin family protein